MNWRIGILTASGVALAGAGALWLANQGSDEADPGPDPDPDPDPDTSDGVEVGDDSSPPPIGDARWGKVPKGMQSLLTATQKAAGIPYLWVYSAICAQGESEFNPKAHNTSKKEITGSTDGLANGLKRGNPSPKHATEIKNFGSGGLFGALAPYFAWIGLDVSFMPFLRRKPALMFEPEASAIFMAHYFWRITAPMYANGRKLNFFDVRVGWASPTMLKSSPFGKNAEAVRGRMREAINFIGWDEDWVASLPVTREPYRGIKAVAGAFGYSPGQED